MRREYASIAAMAALLVGSQAVAIALSPLFQGSGYQAFPNPSDVTNTVVYVILILVFTAVILGLVRYRRQNLAKYVIMASIFITLAFVLLLPLYYGLYYATGENPDPNFQNILANVATLVVFGIAALLVYVLVKFPEWYVVDTIGFVTAACVRRRRDGPREPGGIFLSHAVRPQGQSAGGAPPAERRRARRLPAHEPPRVRVPEPRLGRRVIYPGSVGTTPMALWQGRSKRKPTGGRYRPFRKKRRGGSGRGQQYAFIGAQRLKLYRTKGANRKGRIRSAEFANGLARPTSVTKK